MKVWARYAVPVMVLVDAGSDAIERTVMIPVERFIDGETIGDILFYTEQLEGGRLIKVFREAEALKVSRARFASDKHQVSGGRDEAAGQGSR